MSSYDSSAPRRHLDAANIRVSCISIGSTTLAVVQPISGGTPHFAFVAVEKRVVEPGLGTYSVLYDRNPSQRGLPAPSDIRADQPPKSTPPAQSRSSLIADIAVREREVYTAADSTEIRDGITFEDASHAHDLFVRIRSLADCTDCGSMTTRHRLREALLLHKVTIRALPRAVQTVSRQHNLKDDLRTDLYQEAFLILQKRLASPGLQFVDKGVGPFLAWFDQVVLGVVHEAARTSRVAPPHRVAFVSSERLAPIDTRSQQNDIDDREFSQRMATMIDKLPNPEMRDAVRAIQHDSKLSAIAKSLGISAKRLARLRKKGFEELRRIWPQGSAGLDD